MKPKVKRKKIKILRDTSRVITRYHVPGMNRIPKIIDRVLNLTGNEAEDIMERILCEFSDRHKNIRQILERHFKEIREFIPKDKQISDTKKLLIGAYFTKEYAIESAALFNPSIVPDPDQTDLPAGSLRFIMSLRATGEGHISSIVFRNGIIDKDNLIILNSASEFVETPDIRLDPVYNHHLLQLKLNEMHVSNETTAYVLEQLPDEFTYNELKTKIARLLLDPNISVNGEAIEIMRWLANSNYEIEFHKDHVLSERVIFPVSENEISGIEDARFVQFFDDNGEITYYATYTAYNGINILPQLIETRDFITFNILTLNGRAVQNKGMALFPRKINGLYVMLSRQDGENNHIMYSDNIHFWQESRIIQEPDYPWEFIQIGNCGSPIEIDEGWLVLTHGVGPMRQYCIGAMLLDLEDPSKIIGRLKEPLLTPNEEEREGYVPNVVYSCGSLIHNSELIIPYAMSDIASGIATVNVRDLISCME
ncbi:MAG: glycoside hydrolase family 130 protein [Spirochaetes bacterium]|nr:glycoside hydrolase family 130 protein [Spirochaetota bacterium]